MTNEKLSILEFAKLSPSQGTVRLGRLGHFLWLRATSYVGFYFGPELIIRSTASKKKLTENVKNFNKDMDKEIGYEYRMLQWRPGHFCVGKLQQSLYSLDRKCLLRKAFQIGEHFCSRINNSIKLTYFISH